MRAIIVLSVMLCGCSTVSPDSLVLNGFSKHVSGSKDSTNYGLGLRQGRHEVGFFDNSRKHGSTTYYYSNRLLESGRFFVDAGIAAYDSGRNGRYDNFVTPTFSVGLALGKDKPARVELAASPTDLIYGRGVLSLATNGERSLTEKFIDGEWGASHAAITAGVAGGVWAATGNADYTVGASWASAAYFFLREKKARKTWNVKKWYLDSQLDALMPAITAGIITAIVK